ncbi:MAG: glycine betaine/L-proline ABC transporter ATP-binding protein ProV [Parvibaculaceae bacterium]
MVVQICLRNLYKVFGPTPGAAMSLLRDGASKESVYDRTGYTVGVFDVSLSIDEGEIFVVMGLSGSGKSTLVRLVNRLIEPTSGQILYDGTDIATLSDKDLLQLRRRDMSMVFQSFALMPHMNVIENVSFGMELSRIPPVERRKRAERALEQVNLRGAAKSYPDELSGGMQQRVGLARALANDPSVMLMDEAFSALDPLIRTEMQDELLRIQDAQKRTIIFISHDLNEAMRIGDRIAVMQAGRVVQIGTPDDILNNPADAYVRSFFRGVDVSAVRLARDIASDAHMTIVRQGESGLSTVLERMSKGGRRFAYVVGPDDVFFGVLSQDSVRKAMRSNPADALSAAFIEDVDTLPGAAKISQIIGSVARSPCPLPVVGPRNRYLGAISKETLLRCLDRHEGAVDG